MENKLILASTSPRRKEIMDMLYWDYVIETAEVEEIFDNDLSIEENLKNLAYKKAFPIAEKHRDSIVIGADTVVVAGDEVLGKPKDDEDAKRMLALLSSAPHFVYTGVCVLNLEKGIDTRFVEKTTIIMEKMSKEEIDWYVSTNECGGKAGAYAIQGKGGIFIKEIQGDYYNVVGLPINRLYNVLKDMID